MGMECVTVIKLFCNFPVLYIEFDVSFQLCCWQQKANWKLAYAVATLKYVICNCRNAMLEKMNLKLPHALKTGTTIAGVIFKVSIVFDCDLLCSCQLLMHCVSLYTC